MSFIISSEEEKRRILVVEDCPDTRQMIKHALKHSGFKNIYEASDGKEALIFLNSNRVDLVITDWRMPHMDGLTFFHHVSAKSLRKIPFLMLTAECQRESVLEALEAGVTDYILKPFSIQTLATKVRNCLKRGHPAPSAHYEAQKSN